MGKHTDQRDRTLCLARILYEQTDERHPLTTPQLIRRLEKAGLTAERKSVYRDLASMKKWGFSIDHRRGLGGGWYVSGRALDLDALQAAVDALAVYPWVSETLRGRALAQLSRLASNHQRAQLRRPVALSPRGGRAPSSVRQALDRVYAALQESRALSFHPLDYDLNQGWVAEEDTMVITPKGVLWFQEQYHLLGWDHRTGRLGLYRLDQMDQVKVTGLPAQGPQSDPARLVSAPFGLDDRRRERIRLRCAPAMAVEVLDHLGPGAQLTPEEGCFTVTAEVIVGPAFWGWLAAHGDQAALVSPSWAAALWTTRYCPRLGAGVHSGHEERRAI